MFTKVSSYVHSSGGYRVEARGPGLYPYSYTKMRPEGSKYLFLRPGPPLLRVWMTVTPPHPNLIWRSDPPLHNHCFPINGVCNCPDASKKSPRTLVSDKVATKRNIQVHPNTGQIKGRANGRACVAMVSCDVELYEIEAKCITERIHMTSWPPYWCCKTIRQQQLYWLYLQHEDFSTKTIKSYNNKWSKVK